MKLHELNVLCLLSVPFIDEDFEKATTLDSFHAFRSLIPLILWSINLSFSNFLHPIARLPSALYLCPANSPLSLRLAGQLTWLMQELINIKTTKASHFHALVHCEFNWTQWLKKTVALFWLRAHLKSPATNRATRMLPLRSIQTGQQRF